MKPSVALLTYSKQLFYYLCEIVYYLLKTFYFVRHYNHRLIRGRARVKEY